MLIREVTTFIIQNIIAVNQDTVIAVNQEQVPWKPGLKILEFENNAIISQGIITTGFCTVLPQDRFHHLS